MSLTVDSGEYKQTKRRQMIAFASYIGKNIDNRISTLNLNSSMSFRSSGESLIKIYQEIFTVNKCK